MATADGTVIQTGYTDDLGNFVTIQHKYGFYTRYAHMSAFAGKHKGDHGEPRRHHRVHRHHGAHHGTAPALRGAPGLLLRQPDAVPLHHSRERLHHRGQRKEQRLSDSHVTDDAFINSIIGEGTRFKGEFDLNGLLRIDGDFTGVIRTKGKVLVGKNGRAECTLNAGTVVVGGVLRGEIISTEKVIILSTGLVLGNITTPRLIMEEGVIFNGSCRITAPAAAENGATRRGKRPEGRRAVAVRRRRSTLQGQKR